MFNKKFIIAIIAFLPYYIGAQSWFSKTWHNSVSHYNYYYNANLLVETAKNDAFDGYKDNFKTVLSLYPTPDESALKGNASKMDEAIKKLSRIIDKHSISKWVDDSYLLMGDARFFKGDFYSAIEVYEYVISNYKESLAAQQAEINLITTYIKLGKNDDAEALYNKLKAKKNLSKKLKVQLDIAGAAVHIAQNKYPMAIKLLEEAIPKIKNKNQKIRTNFVLAQLYILTKNNDKGIETYQKVVKLNPKYEFAFNAKLNIAKAINIKNKNEVKNAITLLKSMLNDDKNIDYFSEIYYELGNLEIANKNESNAIENYTKSLRSLGGNSEIKSSTYLALAEIYFKRQDYLNAQVYYDSAARTVEESNPNFKTIQARNLVLNELIKHLVNIKEKDSLLLLSENEKLREKTIDKLIKEEENRVEEEKRLLESQKNQQNFNNPTNGNPSGIVNTNFPFYNQAARTKGLQDFRRVWGDRKHMEYWAISSNKTAFYKEVNEAQKENDYGNEEKDKLMKDDKRKKYYENIPFSKADKEKMKKEIAESYFLGANVYYQNLKEPEKAQKMLENLNKLYPNNSFQINSWYLLAKISKEKNDIPKYDYYMDLIYKKDSTSSFLKILDQKEGSDSINKQTPKTDSEIEIAYKEVYTAYKNKQFDEVLKLKGTFDIKFPGNPIQINFDYLEALAIAEKGDLVLFEKKLAAIVETYPNTEIANQAKETIRRIKIKNGEIKEEVVEKGLYEFNANADHFYFLVVPKGVDLTKIKIAFLNRNKTQYTEDGLRVSNSIIGDQQILIVNNFKTLEILKKYIQEIQKDPKFIESLGLITTIEQYIISKENFTILLQEKKLSDYEKFHNKSYPIN